MPMPYCCRAVYARGIAIIISVTVLSICSASNPANSAAIQQFENEVP
jgi:hypothetical protein